MWLEFRIGGVAARAVAKEGVAREGAARAVVDWVAEAPVAVRTEAEMGVVGTAADGLVEAMWVVASRAAAVTELRQRLW